MNGLDYQLLPTRARTVSERRVELGNLNYARKHSLRVLSIGGNVSIEEIEREVDAIYNRSDDIGFPGTVRFFRDGWEAATGWSSEKDKGKERIYARLVSDNPAIHPIEFVYTPQ